MKAATGLIGLLTIFLQLWVARAVIEVSVNVSAVTTGVDSDWTAVHYSDSNALLLGNDGSPGKGGFHVYKIDAKDRLPEVTSAVTGRTKLVTTVYNVDGKDLAVTIAQPDSILRVFELPRVTRVDDASFEVLGDWSALCSWTSKTANQYLFLFGKHQAVQLLIRSNGDGIKILEVRCS